MSIGAGEAGVQAELRVEEESGWEMMVEGGSTGTVEIERVLAGKRLGWVVVLVTGLESIEVGYNVDEKCTAAGLAVVVGEAVE